MLGLLALSPSSCVSLACSSVLATPCSRQFSFQVTTQSQGQSRTCSSSELVLYPSGTPGWGEAAHLEEAALGMPCSSVLNTLGLPEGCCLRGRGIEGRHLPHRPALALTCGAPRQELSPVGSACGPRPRGAPGPLPLLPALPLPMRAPPPPTHPAPHSSALWQQMGRGGGYGTLTKAPQLSSLTLGTCDGCCEQIGRWLCGCD